VTIKKNRVSESEVQADGGLKQRPILRRLKARVGLSLVAKVPDEDEGRLEIERETSFDEHRRLGGEPRAGKPLARKRSEDVCLSWFGSHREEELMERRNP